MSVSAKRCVSTFNLISSWLCIGFRLMSYIQNTSIFSNLNRGRTSWPPRGGGIAEGRERKKYKIFRLRRALDFHRIINFQLG